MYVGTRAIPGKDVGMADMPAKFMLRCNLSACSVGEDNGLRHLRPAFPDVP